MRNSTSGAAGTEGTEEGDGEGLDEGGEGLLTCAERSGLSHMAMGEETRGRMVETGRWEEVKIVGGVDDRKDDGNEGTKQQWGRIEDDNIIGEREADGEEEREQERV